MKSKKSFAAVILMASLPVLAQDLSKNKDVRCFANNLVAAKLFASIAKEKNGEEASSYLAAGLPFELARQDYRKLLKQKLEDKQSTPTDAVMSAASRVEEEIINDFAAKLGSKSELTPTDLKGFFNSRTKADSCKRL